jgi:hypothetical protein
MRYLPLGLAVILSTTTAFAKGGPITERAPMVGQRALEAGYLKTARLSEDWDLFAKAKMRGTFDHPQPTENLQDQRERVAKAEDAVMQKLDEQFAKGHPEFLKQLETIPVEALADYGDKLMGTIADATKQTAIRKEEVGNAHASGSSTISGRFRGPLGGERGGFSGESSFSSHSHTDQLLLDSDRYIVRLKHAGSSVERLRDESAVGRVEARQAAELAVKAVLVSRVLKRRSRSLAAPLLRWLSHSQIEFVGEKNEPPTTINIRNALIEVPLLLVKPGVVSQRFAATVNRTVKAGLAAWQDGDLLLQR